MDSTYTPAGFWRRFAAHIIDGLILVIPAWIIFYTLNTMPSGIAQLFMMLAGAAYVCWFLSSSWQATPGKRVMGVYIIRAEDGGRLDLARAIKRYLVFNAANIVVMLFMFIYSGSPMGIDSATERRMSEINARAAQGQTITEEEERFLQDSVKKIGPSSGLMLINLLSFGYFLALALTVGLTKEKTGLHDMACQTRAVQGRLDVPLAG